MTTVAWRDGIMAADTQSIKGDMKAIGCIKLFKTTNTRGKTVLLGISGDYLEAMLYVEQYGGCFEEPPQKVTGDVDILIWDGKRLWEDSSLQHPVLVPKCKYYAVGSGASVAMGAMFMGASAKEAVSAAIAIDAMSGGRVVTMSL